MENYAYNSYPDSGDSSPRSREIEFENPTPWEDQSQQPPQNFKAKFMCSYGGKIHPRPHDNQLSYIGGETKILAVDRNIKFSVMISKLSSLCGDTDISFKYQLPGEDLDALISVTNDDDLEHMMHEYDRLYRASAKPARMRLFLFPANPSPASFGSEGSKSERDRFVEALNSGPSHVPDPNKTGPNNVDFLFGLEKGAVPPPPPPVKVPDLPDVHVSVGHDDRIMGPDPASIQTQLQRMQIREQEQLIREQEQQTMYRKNIDDNLVSGFAGEYYLQKLPDRVPPPNLQANVPPTVTAPAGFWHEKQIPGGGFPPASVTVTTTPVQQEQQVYVFPGPAPGTVYHTPVMRPVTGQAGQQYYMQRMGGPDVYREQPVYNMVPPQQQPTISAAAQGHMGVARPSGAGGGGGMTETGYAQMAYDSGVGRQMYYTAQGGVVQSHAPYQAVGGVPVSGEMRHMGGGGAMSQEGKVVVSKVTQS